MTKRYGKFAKFTFTAHASGQHFFCFQTNSTRFSVFAGERLVRPTDTDKNELTQKRVNNTCNLTLLGLSNNGYFLLQCFTEATFGYSDGRAHSRPPHSKSQRQLAESRGKPKPPHRSDDIYYQAPDVSEGKHAFAFHFYPVIVVNRTPSFDGTQVQFTHSRQIRAKGRRNSAF